MKTLIHLSVLLSLQTADDGVNRPLKALLLKVSVQVKLNTILKTFILYIQFLNLMSHSNQWKKPARPLRVLCLDVLPSLYRISFCAFYLYLCNVL